MESVKSLQNSKALNGQTTPKKHAVQCQIEGFAQPLFLPKPDLRQNYFVGRVRVAEMFFKANNILQKERQAVPRDGVKAHGFGS